MNVRSFFSAKPGKIRLCEHCLKVLETEDEFGDKLLTCPKKEG